MNHILPAGAAQLAPTLQAEAHAFLMGNLDMTRLARPLEPVSENLEKALHNAFKATASEAISALGAADAELDRALAATFGWLMVAGPEHLHPMGADCATRIERFIKCALIAAELTRKALDTGDEPRGAA